MTTTATTPAPPARRHHRPGWRDPRILVGIVIVAVSVLLGVKVLASADDTVGVWALRKDLPAGTRVSAGEVERVQIRFDSRDAADRYLSADDPLPADSVLQRAVGRGELLPRNALAGVDRALVEVPVSVEVDEVPSTVREGSVVDVWVTPQTATTAERLADATLVLDDVVVVKAPRAGDTLAPAGTRQIIVGVTADRAQRLGPALGRTSSGRVVITKQG
ncbi:MAG: hypothetical protein ABI873_07915 [Marmoricola sp.]